MRHYQIEQLGPLTLDDIVQLKHFLQSALEHFRHCQTSCEENYLTQLSVIIDCYSLVLLEAGYFTMQDEHFNLLHRYRHFKQHPELISKLSFALAKMINAISEKVGLIEHPWFYPNFVTAVKTILSNKTAYLYGEMEVAQKLIRKILNQGNKENT